MTKTRRTARDAHAEHVDTIRKLLAILSDSVEEEAGNAQFAGVDWGDVGSMACVTQALAALCTAGARDQMTPDLRATIARIAGDDCLER